MSELEINSVEVAIYHEFWERKGRDLYWRSKPESLKPVELLEKPLENHFKSY